LKLPPLKHPLKKENEHLTTNKIQKKIIYKKIPISGKINPK